MQKTSKQRDMYLTDIFVSSYLNQNFIKFIDNSGFIKNSNEIVLFDIKDLEFFSNKYEIIKIYGLAENEFLNVKSNYKLTSSSRVKHIILEFSKEYFSYSNSDSKKIRKAKRKYSNLITEVVDYPKSLNDFSNFLNKWKQIRKNKHFIMLTGIDKHFVHFAIPLYKNRLLSKFFYIGDNLIGFSVIETINESTFNNLFCKADLEYPLINYYIDCYMFELLNDLTKDKFTVNLGSDGGNRSLNHYKANTFKTKVNLVTKYDLRIKTENMQEVNHVIG